MSDLNDLIPPSSGWELLFAHAINASGQITGQGTNAKGERRAYLLTPVPIVPAAKPVVQITGKKKVTTAKAKLTIKGKATGVVTSITAKVGKKTVKATVTNGSHRWHRLMEPQSRAQAGQKQNHRDCPRPRRRLRAREAHHHPASRKFMTLAFKNACLAGFTATFTVAPAARTIVDRHLSPPRWRDRVLCLCYHRHTAGRLCPPRRRVPRRHLGRFG